RHARCPNRTEAEGAYLPGKQRRLLRSTRRWAPAERRIQPLNVPRVDFGHRSEKGMKMMIGYLIAKARRLLFVLVGASLLVGLATPDQCVYDGFENSLSNIWRTDKIAPGALVFDPTIFRAGLYSAQITLTPGDNLNPDGTTERDELQEVNSLNSPERTGY